jgi:hypothetical protein
MPKEKNIYEVGLVYRGQQTWKRTWATSYAEAARKMDVSPSHLRNYANVYRRDQDVEFEGCQGYVNSGDIVFGELGDRGLHGKQMPWEELEKVIQDYLARKHQNSK